MKIMISQRIIMITLSITLYHIIGIQGIILGYAISFLPYSIIVFKGIKKESISINKVKPKINFMLHSYALNLISFLKYFSFFNFIFLFI